MHFFRSSSSASRSKSTGNMPTAAQLKKLQEEDQKQQQLEKGSSAGSNLSAPSTLRKSENVNGDERISISRSDGKIHDLHAISSQYDVLGTTAAGISQKQENKSAERDTNSISIMRSDGLTHDIIQVFKAASDAQGETLKMKSRAPSVGKLDLSVLTGVGNTSPGQPATIAVNRELSSLYYPKHVRIVHFSDTHNLLLKTPTVDAFLPHGNILVHTGNFTSGGTDLEFMQFNEWLGSVTDIYHYRVIVFGHRDVKVYGNNWDVMKKLLSNATHVLCHDEATILGIRFYGAPWHWGHKANYSLRSSAPSTTTCRFDDIPEGIQVLLTHGPSYDRLDTTYSGAGTEHWGSRELTETLKRVKPALHLHGHVKESRGIYPSFGNAPMSVNSAMVDKDMTVLYTTPHVIKATQAMYDKNQNIVTWSFAVDSLQG